jgi:hypothetical protein
VSLFCQHKLCNYSDIFLLCANYFSVLQAAELYSGDRQDDRRWIGKDLKGSSHGLIGHYPCVWETPRKFCQDNKCPGPLKPNTPTLRVWGIMAKPAISISTVLVIVTVLSSLYFTICLILLCNVCFGASGSVVVETLLQVGWSRVRDPMRWMNFFFNFSNPSGRTRSWGLLSL